MLGLNMLPLGVERLRNFEDLVCSINISKRIESRDEDFQKILPYFVVQARVWEWWKLDIETFPCTFWLVIQ